MRHRSIFPPLVLLCALALVLAWWAARGQSVVLVEPSQVQGQTGVVAPMLPCISYSPFRHPEINPFNYQAQVSAAQIEEDLRILKTRSLCVRTYGLSQGLDAVPAVAKKLGMRVKLGVWLARDAQQNQAELERGLALARAYPGVVELLIVGNEVLLRRELSPQALGSVLAYARTQSPVPITYADVWEFWQRHAALALQVDLVTVHILPYWEDNPVAVEAAVGHVLQIARTMQHLFAGKPVWVGETGWPAAGRQRAGAVPGRVEQSRFVRELMQRTGTPPPLDYNLIEGFDQPWKRAFEGAMGGYWGLFDQHGQARVNLTGPVVEDAQWWRGLMGALIGMFIGSLLGALLGKLPKAQPVANTVPVPQIQGLAWSSMAMAGGILGALAPLQWLMVQQWDRTPQEWAMSALLALLGLGVTLTAIAPLVRAPALHASPRLGPAPKRWQKLARIALLFAAATAVLVLALDARYRPFTWWWFLAPCAALAALRLSGQEAAGRPSAQEQCLAGIIAACAVYIAFAEGWHNAQAMAYCALVLVLAGVAGLPSRTNTSSASKAAGAHSSVV
jgi:exo-beta-1,3-glucanase (GH17 family)